MRRNGITVGFLICLVAVWGWVSPAGADPDTSGQEEKKADWTVAHIRLHGVVSETPDELSVLLESTKTHTTQYWLDRLNKAAEDEQVDAVALVVDNPQLSPSVALELAEAIAEIDRSKPVYTYFAAAQFPQYLVAAAGRRVYMEPAGELPIIGLGIEMGFYKGTMDKWGITPQFVQAGQFKGAAEPYMQTGPSEELDKQMNALLDGLYGRLCGAIAEHRGMKKKAVEKAIDHGPLRAEAAKKYGLVDELVTAQSWLGELAKRHPDRRAMVIDNYAKDAGKAMPSSVFAMFSELMSPPRKEIINEPSIAIITAEGVIMPGSSGKTMFGMQVAGQQTLVKAFRQARDEENIKAVVFRINSPGGSALASEMIYQAVQDCAMDKPVVVSIAGMGASGGYYIAMGGHTVFADPMSIVGSIGVVGGRISLNPLLEDQHMHIHSWTRGRHAGLNLSRPWTDEEMVVIRQHINRIYRQFTGRVSDARGEKIKDIDKVAQGRIFTAGQAKQRGLIDAVGGLRNALAEAQKRSGIEGEPNILLWPRPKTLFEMIRGDGDARGAGAGLPGGLETAMRALPVESERLQRIGYLLQLAGILNRDRIMAAMPYHIQVRY